LSIDIGSMRIIDWACPIPYVWIHTRKDTPKGRNVLYLSVLDGVCWVQGLLRKDALDPFVKSSHVSIWK